MADPDLLPLLKQLHFTAGLLPRVVSELAAIARVQDFDAGAVIFREGVHCDEIYLLASGHVALDMNVVGRGPTRILTLRSGDLLGWSALLGEGRMTASATALEPTRLVALAARALRQQCETDHELGYHVMRQLAGALSRRLVATRVQLLDLFAPPGQSPAGQA